MEGAAIDANEGVAVAGDVILLAGLVEILHKLLLLLVGVVFGMRDSGHQLMGDIVVGPEVVVLVDALVDDLCHGVVIAVGGLQLLHLERLAES